MCSVSGQTLAYGAGVVLDTSVESELLSELNDFVLDNDRTRNKFFKAKEKSGSIQGGDKRKTFETFQALSMLDIKPSQFRARQMSSDPQQVR